MEKHDKRDRTEPPAAVPFESWESWTYRHILQEVRALREALASRMKESARPPDAKKLPPDRERRLQEYFSQPFFRPSRRMRPGDYP